MRCLMCDEESSASVRYCINCGAPLISPPGGGPATSRTHPPAASLPTQQWSRQAQGSSHVGASAPPTQQWSRAASPTSPPTQQWSPRTAAMPAGGAPAYQPAPQIQIVNNISVAAAPALSAVVIDRPDGPPLLLRLLYFLFVGLWLGALWTVLSWLLIVSILGLPLGLYMINRLPLVMTLKPPATETRVTVQGGALVLRHGRVAQHPFGLRAAYFLTVGWWASLVWLVTAWTLIVGTLGLGLPVAFWMINRVPAVTTLAR